MTISAGIERVRALRFGTLDELERDRERLAAEARRAARRFEMRQRADLLAIYVEAARDDARAAAARWMGERAMAPRQFALWIVDGVAAGADLTRMDIFGPCRRKTFVRARFTAIQLVEAATGWSISRLGAFFGGRDHTTILHALGRRRRKGQGEAGR